MDIDHEGSQLNWNQDDDQSKALNKRSNPKQKYGRSCLFYLLLVLIIAVLLESYLYLDLLNDYELIQQQLSRIHKENNKQDKWSRSTQTKEIKTNNQATAKTKLQQENYKEIQAHFIEKMPTKLQAISQNRKQKAGMVKTPNGTVSELKQLMRNSQGKGIEEVLYDSEEKRAYRRVFVNRRIDFLRHNKQYQSLGLCKYTIKLSRRIFLEEFAQEGNEYERISSIHKLDKYSQEIPMCIVVPSYNNNAKFRIEFNLNSIFQQNYTNYFAVIIDDASTDGSDELYRKYLHFYNITPSKYVYIHNLQRRTALENIYRAVIDHCSEDSVVINLDGDDELIGKNVLKIFNANYQRTNMGVIYSNYHRLRSQERIELGRTKQYPQKVKQQRSFRTSQQSFSHLKSHRSVLFRAIPLEQLQDDEGKFLTITSDMAIYYPLMELACGQVLKIDGFHYLYNFNTGLNDFATNHEQQLKVERRVRSGSKLPCLAQSSNVKP